MCDLPLFQPLVFIQHYLDSGTRRLTLASTFITLHLVFLARFVKAGDSTKARTELAHMQQNSLTVEAFAAKFTKCASRIVASSVGTPVYSTTQAGFLAWPKTRHCEQVKWHC